MKLNSNFKSLAKGDLLTPHLDKVIAQGDFVWGFGYVPKQGDTAWHPSTDATPSLLSLYQKATGEAKEQKISGSLYKTFMVGHFWHSYIQHILANQLEFCDSDAIERSGSNVWEEDLEGNPLPYHWVKGSGDVAPVSIPSYGDFLLDIKTMNSHDFKKQGLPLWTKDKWECQVNIYMDFFDLDRAIILGVLKDSPHDFKEFEFERNQPLIDSLYRKWMLVGSCVKENVAPPEEEDFVLPLQGAIR